MTQFTAAWGDYPDWDNHQEATFKAKTLREAKEIALSHFDFNKPEGYIFPIVIVRNDKTGVEYGTMPYGNKWTRKP